METKESIEIIHLEKNLKRNKDITPQDIISFINHAISKYNLSEKVKEITLIDNKCMGSYDPNSCVLNINYSLTKEYYPDTREFNLEIINSIFHELTHVVQTYQIFCDHTYKRLPTYYMLLFSCYIAYLNDNNLYLENHDKFIIEYTANICSYINTLKLLRRNNVNKEVIMKVNQDFARKINQYYSNNIPLSGNIHLLSHFTISKKIDNMDINEEVKQKYKYAFHNYGEEKQLTNIERIIYGYYIDNQTADTLNKVECGKVKTLNLIKEIGI